MLIRLLAVAVLFLAAPVVAQDATPAQIAAARAHAAQLITDANASGIFVDKTDGAVVEVMHLASGMMCLLGTEPGNGVHVFPTAQMGIPRGDDVACMVREAEAGLDITTYATRYPGERMTSEAIVSDAVAGIRQRWPDATPYGGDIMTANVDGQPAPRAAAFLVKINGRTMLTMVLGTQIGDWSYKVRITGPADEAEAVSLRGALAMALVQIQPEP